MKIYLLYHILSAPLANKA